MIKMKIHRRAFIFRSDGNAIFENILFQILLLAFTNTLQQYVLEYLITYVR